MSCSYINVSYISAKESHQTTGTTCYIINV